MYGVLDYQRVYDAIDDSDIQIPQRRSTIALQFPQGKKII